MLVLIAGAAAGYGWYLNHEIHRIDLRNLTSAPVKGADAGTENILMIGSTDRCALKVQNPAYGLCSQGVNGVNSDVVMILHLNPTNNSLSILSIPRDLFVPNARSDGANKIDAALYQGPDQLINAIEEDFGIPIQHFVELNFDSFINVVQRARRDQDVLPRAGVRRLLGAQHPDDGLHPARRDHRRCRSCGRATSSTRGRASRRPTRTTGPTRTRATWRGSAGTTSSCACSPPR